MKRTQRDKSGVFLLICLTENADLRNSESWGVARAWGVQGKVDEPVPSELGKTKRLCCALIWQETVDSNNVLS